MLNALSTCVSRRAAVTIGSNKRYLEFVATHARLKVDCVARSFTALIAAFQHRFVDTSQPSRTIGRLVTIALRIPRQRSPACVRGASGSRCVLSAVAAFNLLRDAIERDIQCRLCKRGLCKRGPCKRGLCERSFCERSFCERVRGATAAPFHGVFPRSGIRPAVHGGLMKGIALFVRASFTRLLAVKA